MTIRVLLVDDQELVRAGFRVLVDSADDLEVVGEASNGLEALELTRTRRADLVLMDIRMPVMDGLEATERIAADETLAGVRVLVLTTFEIDEYVVRALRAGASGFLVKNVKPDVLLDAIRTVAGGEALLSPGATRAVITRFLDQPDPNDRAHERVAMLTDREREVLRQVGLGRSNDEIADDLVLSPLTVKTHISRILTKTEARDRAQLVVLAYETGTVRPGRQPDPAAPGA
ncbi:MAG: response regulator [Streptosporangiales bacterium]|nr:response regulator [Streptosporangiales bacterium]